MKTKIFIIILLTGLFHVSLAQEMATSVKWNWLMGEWKGEGGGQPGEGKGTFTFAYDLGNKIIVRKNHAEYPAKDEPSIKHDDLMIVYANNNGEPTKAIYFDNEGHDIEYGITYFDKKIVLTSGKTANEHAYRLTYTLMDDGLVDIKFEASQDGEKYVTYLQGKCKKVK